MFDFKWKSSERTATKDRAVLMAWEKYEITTSMAIKLLRNYNEWRYEPTPEEFRIKAAELGYHRYLEEATGSKVS